MGLVDELITSLTTSDRNMSNDQASTLVQGVLEALTGGQEGGIEGLSRRFQSAGLGDVISSWIGTGANKPVEPSALDRVLRGSPLETASSRAGFGGIDGAAALSVLLPKLVDKLTPDGQVPTAERLREVAAPAASSEGSSSRPKADFSKVRSGASSTAAPPAPTREQTYTVVKGDSLSKIAKKLYGDANQWKRIFEANRDQIENPDLIHPGQVLRIPN